ncbi:MAG: DNA topoisomerase 3 [Lachnospiraceae bacterium]|nr:DNA topoisomerase 3 [Lachnospiraceae bacterium]
MELVITEKPSVARSIAKVIGADEPKEGYLEGNGYIVSWCYGHLIELVYPEEYDPSYKHWTYGALPIIPETWKYKVKRDTAKQFNVLKWLMWSDDVENVICATDAGREGELIFRLVYEQAGCNKPIKRLWISSMEERAIHDGFKNLKPGFEYDNLYRSAVCRQEADWLVGLNGTRLFTVLYRNKVLKVGRVQTPTLAMLVERETAIRDFKKIPYYTVHLNTGGMEAVSEKYTDKAMADEVAHICNGADACVKSVDYEYKSVTQPKLYDLTTLQRDANRIFGFTAKKTLEYTQSLYEKKLCTYPRTDSQYLSDDMEGTIGEVRGIIKASYPYLTEETAGITDLKRVLNSKKVTDHHAIIPTVEIRNLNNVSISEGELKVLSLISARVMAATSGKYEYRSAKAVIICEGIEFTAKGRAVIKEGFKAYERVLRSTYKVRDDNEGEEDAKALPFIGEGEILPGVKAAVVESYTKPPAHFTEDSLLQAMEKAGAGDTDDDAERKGLGTPATRADIIEKLVKDGFVRRDKKQMIPTEDGEKLITILPDVVKSPKLTADWENALTLMAKGRYDPEQFMRGIKNMITELVKTYHEVGEENRNMFGSNNVLGKCPKCGGDVINGKFGPYCSEKCGMTIGKAFGKELTEEQVKDLLEDKKIFVQGLKSKKGGTYDAYLIPDGIQEYSYTKNDGTQINGFQFKFNMEFPKKEDKEA